LDNENDKRENDSAEDEIRPEDGCEQYWFFINGEQVRLFSALAAAIFFVLWCFLYILGGASILENVLLALAVIGLAVWRIFDKQLRYYQERGWTRDRRSAKRAKIEARVAIALWLLISVPVFLINLQQWRRSH
jgi:hypothetical protein